MKAFALAVLVGAPQDAPRSAVATAIAVGELREGALPAGERSPAAGVPCQRYLLHGPREGIVTITLESHDFDALLRVEDADGALLGEDDDSGIETDARLELELSAGQRVAIAVSGKGGSGSFRLAVREGPSASPHALEELDACIAWRSTAAGRALERGDVQGAATHRDIEATLRKARLRWGSAIEAHESALARARESGDLPAQARALADLGIAYHQLGYFPRAIESYGSSIALARGSGRAAAELQALGGLANAERASGDLHGALVRYGEWRARAEELGDRRSAIEALGGLGIVHVSMGELVRARECLEEQLFIAHELGDRDLERRALVNLGITYGQMGDLAQARESLEHGLELAREAGDRMVQATVLCNLGVIEQDAGDFGAAREHLEESLVLARELGHRALLPVILDNLGSVAVFFGDPARARELYEEACSLARDLGDRSTEASATGNLGSLVVQIGDPLGAIELLERSRALAREIGDRRAQARAIGNLGVALTRVGEHLRAKELLEECLVLARQLGDRSLEGHAHVNLGVVYAALGDLGRAERHYREQLALARALGARADEANALGSLGALHYDRREPARALELFLEQLALAREIGDRLSELRALANLGLVSVDQGEPERAVRQQREASTLAEELGNAPTRAVILANLANAHLALGEPRAGMDAAREAVALCVELGLEVERVFALLMLARSALALGDLDSSLVASDEAGDLVDRLASAGLEREESIGFRARFAELGEVSQDLAWQRWRSDRLEEGERVRALERGFREAGRWKGRALLEGMLRQRGGGRSAEARELFRARRSALGAHAALLDRALSLQREGHAPEEIARARADAATRLEEAVRLAARLRELAPREAGPDLPRAVGAEEARRALLGPGTLLLEYVEGSERLYVYALDAVELRLLELGERSEIAAEVDAFLTGLRDPLHGMGPAELGRRGNALFERLLAPVLATWPGSVERLLFVPTAALAALPFDALVIGSQNGEAADSGEFVFVLDRFETSHGPSVPVLVELAALRPRAAAGKLLLLADPRYASESLAEEPPRPASFELLDRSDPRSFPDASQLVRLPSTRQEALAIAELLVAGDEAELGLTRIRRLRDASLESDRIDIHLGRRASRERLSGELRGCALLHIACHGFIDTGEPLQSGIALSPHEGSDGFFTIQDALDLELDANLVVLSACETAVGGARAGEGIESLARAFLHAGARALVASLWKVDDEVAALTMRHFYQGLFERGLTPPRALREARLALRRGASPRGLPVLPDTDRPARGSAGGHPRDWAPFVHLGLAR